MVLTLIMLSTPCYAGNDDQYIEGEILVKFKDGVCEKQKENTRALVRATMKKEIKTIRVELWSLPKDITVIDALNILKNNKLIDYAEPNYVNKLNSIPNDSSFNYQWALYNQGQEINGFEGVTGADIKISEAWDIYSGQNEVIVAVIDSGCAFDHPDLIDNIWINDPEFNGLDGFDDDGNGYIDDFIGYNFMDDFPSWMVVGDYNHGTHVSGIIAASINNGLGISGICENIKIMPLRVTTSSGGINTCAALEAFEYAHMNGAKVINCSWGNNVYSQTLYDEISLLNKSGILVVVAAGNGGDDCLGDDNDSMPAYPASYNLPNIISVAATDNNDNLTGFSNYGLRSVDVAAPGTNIYSTIPSQETIFSESFETGATKWITTGTGLWTIAYNQIYGTNEATFYFYDNYVSFEDIASSIQLNVPINLTEKWGNKLIFDARWNIPYGAIIFVEATTNPNDEDSWIILSYQYGSSWVTRTELMIPLDNFGFSNVTQMYIRFGVYCPDVTNYNHWIAVDDIRVTSFVTFTYTGKEYSFMDGTSMAAPIVSGIVGLVWSQYPNLNHLQVKEAILDSVDKLSSLNGKVVTGGRVNAYEALIAAEDMTPGSGNSSGGGGGGGCMIYTDQQATSLDPLLILLVTFALVIITRRHSYTDRT